MNRRNFSVRLIGGAGVLTLGSWVGTTVSASVEAAPGWSSARAVRRLTGARFRVEDLPGTLELVDVTPYRDEDRQFTVRFRRRGPRLSEGIYRLRAADTHVDLFLQPVHGEADSVEAVFSHTRG